MTDNHTEVCVPRKRHLRVSKIGNILSALRQLREARISIMDLLAIVLSGKDAEFRSHRKAFLSDTERIRNLLDIIWLDNHSHSGFESWLDADGLDHICHLVSNEIESAKPKLHMKLESVSPDYIEHWDVNEIMGPIATDLTPTWSRILYAASEPRASQNYGGKDELRMR